MRKQRPRINGVFIFSDFSDFNRISLTFIIEIAKKEVFGNTGIFLSFQPDCPGRPLANGFKLEFADNPADGHRGINDDRGDIVVFKYSFSIFKTFLSGKYFFNKFRLN